MANKTFDLDDYISQRKEKDSEFAKDFDTGYEEFKIGMMIKEMRLESGMTQEQLAEKLETKKSVISRMIKSFFVKNSETLDYIPILYLLSTIKRIIIQFT